MVVTASGDAANIAWQSTVVDIAPTSRYDPEGKVPDTAVVNTTLGLLGEDGEVRVLRLNSTIPVFPTGPEPGAPYRFMLHAPEEFTQLVKGADLSIVVLLPRLSERDPTLSQWRVRVADYSREGEPVALDTDGPGRRASISWYLVQDPDSIIDYIYETVSR